TPKTVRNSDRSTFYLAGPRLKPDSLPRAVIEFLLEYMKAARIALLLAAFGAAVFIFGGLIRAADTNFPIYFPDGKLILKGEGVNRSVYLPLRPIIEHIGLPYTDALALETLTIRSAGNRLVVKEQRPHIVQRSNYFPSRSDAARRQPVARPY